MTTPDMESVPEQCVTCKQLRMMCFCDAPKTEQLRIDRLRWANITHPVSKDLNKQLDRLLNEPQSFQDFAKQTERENGILARACNEKDAEITRLRAELAEEKRKVEEMRTLLVRCRETFAWLHDRHGAQSAKLRGEEIGSALAALTTPSEGGE